MENKIVAKILIFDAQNSILLLKRSGTHPRFPHDFDLPGGEVEEGEEPVDAVAREIEEETGMIVSPHNIQFARRLDSTDGKQHELYTTRIDADMPAVNLSWEHESYEWTTRSAILSERPAKDTYMDIAKSYLEKHTK
jgi:8-oxo-dGTP diphosphatase